MNVNDVELIPVNSGVLLKFYEDNPYKSIEKTSSGLIVGVESTQKYKSNETGEMEENTQVIICAKVIAVGPECKNVKVGEDVYVIKHFCNPIPFRKLGYYMLAEQNIMCRVASREKLDGIQGTRGCSCDIANDKEQWEATPEIYNEEYVKQMKEKKYGNN